MRWSRIVPGEWRKWLIVPPVLIGAGIIGFSAMHRARPARKPVPEAARTLRVIAVPRVDVLPRVIGHGTAEPGKIWKAIAEVEGRVVETHPELKPGTILSSGTLLLRIDPTEYNLRVVQFKADLQQIDMQIEELETREANMHTSLKIEEESLAIARNELDRLRRLAAANSVSRSSLEQQQRAVLTQTQKVQELTNSIKLVPVQKKTLEATRAVKQAGLAQAELDLKKTVITAPFDCRLVDISVERGQYLARGQVIGVAHGTAVTEINSQVAFSQARRLIPTSIQEKATPQQPLVLLNELKKMDVVVRMYMGDYAAEWKGRFARIWGQVDRRTRTIGFVVAVDNPYKQVIPGKRPPLVQGSFCEVELVGSPRKGRLVIPRTAVYRDRVYVLDASNRLRARPVRIEFYQADFACVAEGLKEGEQLIVSDPTPAIDGMLIKPIADASLRRSLIRQATKGGAGR